MSFRMAVRYYSLAIIVLMIIVVLGAGGGLAFYWLGSKPLRWQDANDCRHYLYERFPPGTPWDVVDDWVKQQPYTDWASYNVDRETGEGSIPACIYNREGEPGWYDDYISVVFTFDQEKRLKSIKTWYVPGRAYHRFDGH
jgi:hypothetical protein